MSATFETTSSFWRKRLRDEDNSQSQMDRKRLRYYYKLESESSKASEDDTESVYSLQGRETDFVRDSSDTDTNLDVSEYEVDSFTENEIWEVNSNTSSGSENLTLGHLVAAAQAIYDSSMEKWITDCEESDNSSLDDSSISRSDFSKCAQCKSLNVNSQYRYCEKCYQSCRQCKMQKTYKGFPLCISCHKDRKKFFPPRPRGNKKPRNSKKKTPVKLENLKSALSGLSQDSGIGSSQEMTSFPSADSFDLAIEPQKTSLSNVASNSTSSSNCGETSRKSSTDAKSRSSSSNKNLDLPKNSRKRYISESSLSDFEIKKPKLDEKLPSQTSDLGSEISTSSYSSSCQAETSRLQNETDDRRDATKSSVDLVGKSTVPPSQNEKENSELCIICNNAPKDSIFLHTNIAHQCCCYRCAKRTLHTIKRCPICNRSVNKVVKIYTS